VGNVRVDRTNYSSNAFDARSISPYDMLWAWLLCSEGTQRWAITTRLSSVLDREALPRRSLLQKAGGASLSSSNTNFRGATVNPSPSKVFVSVPEFTISAS
jgi:hypothetical protein